MTRHLMNFSLSCLFLVLVACTSGVAGDAGQEAAVVPNQEIVVVHEPERDADGKIVPVTKSPEAWQAELTEEEYRILRESGTERRGTGPHLDNKEEGVYACAGCGLALFKSETKYESGSGWPSFYQPIHPDHVANIEDTTHGMVRVENRCARCNGHLGHVFNDGPQPTGERYCMNGTSLKFVAVPDGPDAAASE